MTGDYDGPDRRDPPEIAHVSVDSLSNGAARTFDRVERRFDRTLKVLWLLVTTVIGSSVALGAWYSQINSEIAARPTVIVTRQMVDEATDELLDEIAANTAADRVSTDATTAGLTQLRLTVEALTQQQLALRRDVDRIDRR